MKQSFLSEIRHYWEVENFDAKIHRAVGPELLHEFHLLAGCKTSDSRLTKTVEAAIEDFSR